LNYMTTFDMLHANKTWQVLCCASVSTGTISSTKTAR